MARSGKPQNGLPVVGTKVSFRFPEMRQLTAVKLDTNLQIGILYNHSAWPRYLDVSRPIEAQWINACRIVRVTQQQAGLADLL
jgi:hypothetical protein